MVKLTDLHYAWTTLQAFCPTIEINISRQRLSCQRCNCVIIIVSSSKRLRGKKKMLSFDTVPYIISRCINVFCTTGGCPKNFCIFPNPYTEVFRKNTESLKSSAQQTCEIFSLIVRKHYPRNPSCDWINVELHVTAPFLTIKREGIIILLISGQNMTDFNNLNLIIR